MNYLNSLEKEYKKKLELELRNNQLKGLTRCIDRVISELFEKIKLMERNMFISKCTVCGTETEVEKLNKYGQEFLICEDCKPVLDYMVKKLEDESNARNYNKLAEWKEVLKDELQ